MQHSPQRVRGFIVLLLVASLSSVLSACGRAERTATSPEAPASWESTIGTLAASKPAPSQRPPDPMLRDPRTAVYSYMLWISYAYRTLNSNATSQAYDSYQGIRVGSYVDFNRQEKRALDQRLLVANVKSAESVGNTATVTVHEEWAYRNIDITTGEYSTPIINVTYETTYTVVRERDNWLVHSVEASRTSQN